MECPQCKCKFKEKYQRWTDKEDGSTVIHCPKCNEEIDVPAVSTESKEEKI